MGGTWSTGWRYGQQWSTWNEERVEGLKIVYGEKRAGVGGVQTWTDARGSGKMWITKSEYPSRLEYSLKFGEFPKMLSQMKLEAEEGQTHLTWSSQGRLPGGAFYGFSALVFPAQMTYQYEQSLEQLKKLLD